VLFIDDDMAIDADAFLILARRRLPIVVCNYRMRGPPAEFTAMRLDHQGRIETTVESTGLEPCDYAGFGLSLIETRVFKAMQRPHFLNRYIDDAYSTEDVPFFLAAREAGFTAYVDHDASKRIGHVGQTTYRWDQDHSIRMLEGCGGATKQSA
jgi:hypothetical protein